MDVVDVSEQRVNHVALNLKFQVDYMCEEIARALGIDVQSPSDTVQSVRDYVAIVKAKESSGEIR